ncbi:unnamed protein product [Heterobilharzia americana]|nr:unnamed protein product [Heterobilharzia americana]
MESCDVKLASVSDPESLFISSSHFSAAPCRDNPIVKRNKHRKRSRRFCISSRKTKQLSASTKSRSQYTNNSKYKLISKEDLISLKLVSSLDLDEDPEAKFSRTPHWIYTYASEYEKNVLKTHLLLGDVTRIAYLLLRNRKYQPILIDVLKHCWHFCHRVPLADIHIRTSVGLSSLKSVRLAQHSTTISSSTLLFVVQWSSDSVLKGTLAIACSCLPPNGSWYNCCSKKFLQTISRLILKPEAKKHILELSKNFSAKPHQISSVSLLSPAVIMSQSGNDAHLTAHSLGDSVFQNANLYKDLLGCLPKSISTILRNNIGLSLEHIAAFGLLISSFHNTCVYVFSEVKTTTDCNSSSLSDERLSVNLFTGIQSLHHVVSSCLCRLRDSYASLMSAGACLKARYELSNANFHDLQQPPYMRIARGRARLFESESAARENIRRIFTEEVSPHILHLINVLENLNHSLRRISSNIFLLGPFFHRDTSFDDRHLSLLTSKQWVHESLEYTQNTIHSTIPLTELEFTIFIDTSFFLLEYLTSNVYKHIHMLSDNIQSFKHELSQTYSSIVDTWIPAYKELSTTVNSRADVDLTYFFSSLQSQYDVIEAWTRHQHETELRHIGSNMINLLTKLSDCWRCQSLYRNLNLPCRNLSVPYGSRNNPSQPMVKEMKIDSLLPWPPKHPSSVLTQHSVQRNIQEFQSKTACSANNDSEEFVYSRMTFSQDKSNKIPKSNMNMSHSVTVSNGGREVESFIRHQGSSYCFETVCDGQSVQDTSSVSHSVDSHSPNLVLESQLPIPSGQPCPGIITNVSPFHSHPLQITRKLPIINDLSDSSVSISRNTEQTAGLVSSSNVISNTSTMTDPDNSQFESVLSDISGRSIGEKTTVNSSDQDSCRLYECHSNNNSLSTEASYLCDANLCSTQNETNISQCNQNTETYSQPTTLVHKKNDMSFQTNSQYHVEPLDQSSSLDMNHAPTYTTPKKASPISDSSGTCLPLLPHGEFTEVHQQPSPLNSEKHINSMKTSSSKGLCNSSDGTGVLSLEFDTTKSTTVMTSDLDSLLDKDSSISYTQPISDSHMNSQKSTCFSLYDDISTDSYSNCDITQKVTSVSSTDITDSRKLTKEKSIKKVCIYLPNNAVTNCPIKDIVSQCNKEENHSNSDEPDSCIMSLDRRRAGKLKRKLKKINHSEFAKQLSAIVATTPETLDTPEITFVTDGKNKLHDTQHLSNLCPMPITNSSLSVEETSHASHNLTSNNEKQTIAGFGCLTSWFREKTLNPQAPGPVTAAILGQSKPSVSSISIDLTVDD